MGCSYNASTLVHRCAVNYDSNMTTSNFTINKTDATVWKLVPNSDATAWTLQSTWLTSKPSTPVFTLCHRCNDSSAAIASNTERSFTRSQADNYLGFKTFQKSVGHLISTKQVESAVLSPLPTDDVVCDLCS